MLDLLFWSVVALVLWFSYDTWRFNRDNNVSDHERNAIEMETLDE